MRVSASQAVKILNLLEGSSKLIKMVEEAPETISLFTHNFPWLAVQEPVSSGGGRRSVRGWMPVIKLLSPMYFSSLHNCLKKKK